MVRDSGLLSEGYLHLSYRGLIFGRAYFCGGGGGALIIKGILHYNRKPYFWYMDNV